MTAATAAIVLFLTAGGKLARRSVYTLAEATGLHPDVVRTVLPGRNPAHAASLAGTYGVQVTFAPVSQADAPVEAAVVAPVTQAPARKRGNPNGRHPVTGKFMSNAQARDLAAREALKSLSLA